MLTASQNGSTLCPAHLPFAFVCSNCDEETVVERSDARGLALNPDSLYAMSIVLQQRGWLQDEINGLIFCPNCTDIAA